VKRIVIAIGGNSLIRDSSKVGFEDQYRTVLETCRPIARLITAGHQLVVTHGNGPQVGFLLLRSHLSRRELPEIPLDCANALTQGEIGYMIQQGLENELSRSGVDAPVVTLVTQVVVAEDDERSAQASKPVGPFYSRREAAELEAQGWTVKEDAGRGYRRVVPSPEPISIVEEEAIRTLLDAGAAVITVGGGGIPVIKTENGLKGVPAVIDKDRASALLATRIKAHWLLISTSVDKVYLNYNRTDQRPLHELSSTEAQELYDQGQFPPGSMGPKIEAALRFLKSGGEAVIITSPDLIEAAIDSQAGTRIIP
jgi:carbamate kinase